jgi:DNA ligase-1
LQKRLGRKTVSAKQLADNPAVLIAFDLLYLDGRLLLDEPLDVRQALLRELAANNPSLIVLPSANHQHAAEIEAAFEAARAAGNEGLMLKDPKSTYTPGRRGGAWLKLKSHLPTLDCVVVAAEYGHGRRRSSLSDYTFAVWDRDPAEEGATLVNIAKAYSGLTDAEIADLTQLFLSLAISDNGRVFRVKPQVVMELAFDQILESARHASGFALRFPRIKHIRTDKRIEDADRLDRVREIYQSVGNLGRKQDAPIARPVVEPTLFD